LYIMLKEKQEKYGSISQRYTITLKYCQTVRENGILVKRNVEKSSDLDIAPYQYGKPFDFQDIIEFGDSGNALLAESRSLMREGTYITFEITSSAYEDVPEYLDENNCRCTSRQIAFDRWEYAGDGVNGEGSLDLEDEEGGLYMRPDSRYTDETHDAIISWNKDFLRSLAEYHM